MKSRDLAVLRWLIQEARPYWPHIVAIFLLSLLATPLALLTPVPIQIAVDSAIGSEPLPAWLEGVLPLDLSRSPTGVLWLATGLLIGIALLNQLQAMAASVLSTYTAQKLVLRIRAKLFRHLQRLSLSYHDSRGTSDSAYRVQHDAIAVQSLLIDNFIPSVTACCTLVAMLYVTYRLDAQLASVALAVSPPILFLVRSYRPRMRREARQVKRFESASFSVVQEALGALRIVKAFGQEDREQKRFLDCSNESLRAQIRLALAEGSLGLLLGLAMALGSAAVLYIGVRNVRAGTLTLGELLLIMTYLAQLYSPLKTLGRKAASLQRHLASTERMFSVFDETPDIIERAASRPIARAKGAVTLRGVTFAYDPGHPVLSDVSIEIPAGTRVGVAGETGAGKTTLMGLLIRFHDPTAGQILLDGVDLRDYKVADLRAQFAIVLQESVLFSTSIAENIAYARPDASEESIVSAAKDANAHDFIVRLPDGYETQVGERGLRLSGGERQRIALARAFLVNAPILIMDEPTSAVDVKTEAGIMEAMERLMRGRTCFLTTHRLTTLASCDLLLVLDGGRLVDVRSDVKSAVQAIAAGGAPSHR
ncbi:MAG TPA: ABC transporter ATP-binding protein [Vicinamibacteria bacterium]|nr:ABC transporter ATP-binding protein [Vicinamibacteria bacterium]